MFLPLASDWSGTPNALICKFLQQATIQDLTYPKAACVHQFRQDCVKVEADDLR